MVRAWFAVSLATFSQAPQVSAQTWFDQAEHPGPMGDFTQEEREALKDVDPGLEGSARAVGSANTHFEQQLIAHGAEPNNHFGVYPPSDWERKAGVKILNATPFNSSGAMVVRTDHGLMPAPLVWGTAAWELADRPRRMALMVIEMIEDYRPYLGYLIPKVKPLVDEFRAQGMPVLFSNWAHRPGDGLYGGLDRAAGSAGLSTKTNIQFTYKDGGLYPMKELMPTEEELRMGHFIKSIHLNKFADLDSAGRSILADRLAALGVDTLVLTGGWTNACIIATALDAVDTKNLDALIVSDAVGTAMPGQESLLESVGGIVKLQDSAEVVSYLQAHKGNASFILAPDLDLDSMVAKYTKHAISSSHPMLDVVHVPILALTAGVFVAAVQSVRRSIAPVLQSPARSSEPLFEEEPCLERV